MPELLEVEAYARTAQKVIGREIVAISVSPQFMRGSSDGLGALEPYVGGRVESVARVGKVLFLHVDSAPALAVRFGMTGRIEVDGQQPIDKLLYSSGERHDRWVRMRIEFAGGGDLVVIDQRSLGSLEVDPDMDLLGPDAVGLTAAQAGALFEGHVSIKARLMDQSRVAGLGNLLADDCLWRAGIAPPRISSELSGTERQVLVSAIGETLAALRERGGSHMGDLQAFRKDLGACPACGGRLKRTKVGGRTTVWCEDHQR